MNRRTWSWPCSCWGSGPSHRNTSHSPVAFDLSEKGKAIVADLAGVSAVVYLTELDEVARGEALRNAGVLLTFNTSKKLRRGEAEPLDGARLIQFMIGGVDFIPLGELPKGAEDSAHPAREHAVLRELIKLAKFEVFVFQDQTLSGGKCHRQRVLSHRLGVASAGRADASLRLFPSYEASPNIIRNLVESIAHLNTSSLVRAHAPDSSPADICSLR